MNNIYDKIKNLINFYSEEIRRTNYKISFYENHNFILEHIFEKEKLDIYKRIRYKLENLILDENKEG